MLNIKQVSKTFHLGTANEKKAIDKVDLTLETGDFVSVIGGNGAGKSTLLNLIAGVYPIDCGTIHLADENISLYPEYKRSKLIGRVFQDPMMGTAADMGIDENLAMANRRGKARGLRWGISSNEHTTFKTHLEKFDLGLENRLDAKVGLLSGGQRQALTLLMATVQKPKLLLLDEHTAALDPKTAKKVLELTDEIIKEKNLTAFMVTHNMKDAITYGNRLIMMDKGKIIFDIKGEAKKKLTVRDLLTKFESATGEALHDDAILLVKEA
ncbi:MAG: ABC transporter ATP-binding protein [Breznakia sp.]